MRLSGRGGLVGFGMVVALYVASAHASSSPTSAAARKEAALLNRLPAVNVPRGDRPRIDHSGRKEKGIASWYGGRFDGRLMANGRRMDPHANTAASKTLPLGTTANVVNLDNGRSVTVKVEDRGPFVDGRVVDVTPKVATELHMTRKGVVPVVVKPIAVPQRDGTVKLGAGAAGLSLAKIEQATRTTEALIGARGEEIAER